MASEAWPSSSHGPCASPSANFPSLELPRSLRLSSSFLPRALHIASFLLLPLLLTLPCVAQGTSSVGHRLTYEQCTAPAPVLVKKSGTATQNVLALCASTQRGLSVTLDNIDKMFIGNSSTFRDFGTACYNLDLVLYAAQNEDGSYEFNSGDLPPEFGQQSWNLNLWPKFDPDFPQSIELTVSNFGPTVLDFTGINYTDLGLPSDFKFLQDNSTTISVEYSKVSLTYETLPVLEEYLLGGNNDLVQGVQAVILIIYPSAQTGSLSLTITYALVDYKPGNTGNELNFVMHESTYFAPQMSITTTGRRLLVAAPTNKAPAAACSGASCRPVAPLPLDCRPRTAKYPACTKKCSCFSK